jgi:hypothetical protein
MKYLNINQSLLKADNKYSLHRFTANNAKHEFTKVTALDNYPYQHLDDVNANEDLLISLFKKYMNNDIWIDWYK